MGYYFMKKCFKCGKLKQLNMFYKHKAMSDGHVNKCKECNKKDVRENRVKKLKYYRDYDAYRYQNDPNVRIRNNAFSKEYRISNPEKYAAHTLLNNAVRDGRVYKPNSCSICNKFTPKRGLHGHHEDYYKPLDVIWVCVECHHHYFHQKKLT